MDDYDDNDEIDLDGIDLENLDFEGNRDGHPDRVNFLLFFLAKIVLILCYIY